MKPLEGKITVGEKEVAYHLIVSGKPFDYVTKMILIEPGNRLSLEEQKTFEREINRIYERVDGYLYPD